SVFVIGMVRRISPRSILRTFASRFTPSGLEVLMRSATLVFLLSLLTVATLAQDTPQRGRVKKFDAEKGLITIATADGKEVEAAIVPQTQTRNAEGQEIADFRSKGVPAGTNVMFKVQERGGRTVLEGL